MCLMCGRKFVETRCARADLHCTAHYCNTSSTTRFVGTLAFLRWTVLKPTKMRGLLEWLKKHKWPLFAVCCVLLPAPLLFVSFGSARERVPAGFYTLICMSLLWAVAPISIYITALFPLFLLPLCRIASADEVAMVGLFSLKLFDVCLLCAV